MNVGEGPWQLWCRMSVDVVPEAASCDLVDVCECPTRDCRRISNFNQLLLFPPLVFFRLVAIVSANLLACSHKLRLATFDFCWHFNKETSWRQVALENLNTCASRRKLSSLKPQDWCSIASGCSFHLHPTYSYSTFFSTLEWQTICQRKYEVCSIVLVWTNPSDIDIFFTR